MNHFVDQLCELNQLIH